jgi:hypothetical protein
MNAAPGADCAVFRAGGDALRRSNTLRGRTTLLPNLKLHH